MEKPLYAGETLGNRLWIEFRIVIILETIFRQARTDGTQQWFRELLTNIHNATPTLEDWNLLQYRTNTFLLAKERSEFDTSIHLFATNILAKNHNKYMLQSLAMPIARFIADFTKRSDVEHEDDHQLDQEILLCVGQRVMLTCSLLVQSELVNGALGVVIQIVYRPGSNPPQSPAYVVVEFDNYIGFPWDQSNPKHIPIPPIQRNNRKQVPLKMAWALTIHKSQGLTLTRSTIDIGNTERQGLTFTSISRTTTLQGMWIAPAFSFEQYAKMNDTSYVSLRKEEEKHLQTLSLLGYKK